MKCPNCGATVDYTFKVCPYCGENLSLETQKNPYPSRPANAQENSSAENPEDYGAAGFGVLGFFIPLVGLILYLVWKNTLPKRAKAAGKGALISVILGFVLVILYIILLAAVFI